MKPYLTAFTLGALLSACDGEGVVCDKGEELWGLRCIPDYEAKYYLCCREAKVTEDDLGVMVNIADKLPIARVGELKKYSEKHRDVQVLQIENCIKERDQAKRPRGSIVRPSIDDGWHCICYENNSNESKRWVTWTTCRQTEEQCYALKNAVTGKTDRYRNVSGNCSAARDPGDLLSEEWEPSAKAGGYKLSGKCLF